MAKNIINGEDVNQVLILRFEYVTPTGSKIKEETISMFDIRARFTFNLHKALESNYSSRPISIVIPKEFEDSKYISSKFLKGKLHPLWRSVGGFGLQYC
jgi:hypothetical protein